MDEQTYEKAAEVENDHWWFRARRQILGAVIEAHLSAGDAPPRILEAGCGNGGNLELLARYGTVFAIEKDDGARARAAKRGVATVERGWLPDVIPFPRDSFDLIAALDVLEHVDDDAAALRVLSGYARAGGLILITVPAFRWLWSVHDTISHHLRRYTREQVTTLLEGAGLTVQYAGYFNFLLFPMAVASIQLGKLMPRDDYRGMHIPPAGINRSLERIFAVESRLVPRLRLPFGLSIVACATRR